MNRLLLDEMYPMALALSLHDLGHDVTAGVSTMPGAEDERVLISAAEEGRRLLTENIRDFSVLARHIAHAGILLAHGGAWPRTPSGIARLTKALDHLLTTQRLPAPGEVDWLRRATSATDR